MFKIPSLQISFEEEDPMRYSNILKYPMRRMRRKAKVWEKIFEKDLFDKGMVGKIYK